RPGRPLQLVRQDLNSSCTCSASKTCAEKYDVRTLDFSKDFRQALPCCLHTFLWISTATPALGQLWTYQYPSVCLCDSKVCRVRIYCDQLSSRNPLALYPGNNVAACTACSNDTNLRLGHLHSSANRLLLHH